MERRQGRFRRSRLKLKDGNRISLPSGEPAREGGQKLFAFSRVHGWFLQIFSTKSQFRHLHHTSGAGVC